MIEDNNQSISTVEDVIVLLAELHRAKSAHHYAENELSEIEGAFSDGHQKGYQQAHEDLMFRLMREASPTTYRTVKALMGRG